MHAQPSFSRERIISFCLQLHSFFRFPMLMPKKKKNFFFPFKSAPGAIAFAATAKDGCFQRHPFAVLLSSKSFLNIFSLLFYEYLKISSMPRGLLKELFFPLSFMMRCQLLCTVQSILIKKAAHRRSTAEISAVAPGERFNMDKM